MIEKISGPVTVADFMRMVNTHPKYGYYIYKDVFGRAGDFITAPEISQLFGEIIGAFLLHMLQTFLGYADGRGVRLVELGPGRGTLMLDILRTLGQFGTVFQRIKECILVEASHKLRQAQESLLRRRFPNISLSHHAIVDDIPESDLLTICYSNEFFDALPIHIFHREVTGWREVLVDGFDAADDVHFRLVKSLGPTASSKLLRIETEFGHLGVGQSIEICPETSRIAEKISGLVQRSGGIFLTVDYGRWETPSGTLRAIQNHQILSSPLENVGEADLSADVDFGKIVHHFPETRFHLSGPMPQMEFLEACGIKSRLAALLNISSISTDTKRTLQSGVDRLIDPKGMGQSYKVFAAITK